MDDIAKWRKQIDEIDDKIVKLVNERAACAEEIGKIKNKNGLEIYNPEREKYIMRHISEVNKGPLDNYALMRIFEIIIGECRDREGV